MVNLECFEEQMQQLESIHLIRESVCSGSCKTKGIIKTASVFKTYLRIPHYSLICTIWIKRKNVVRCIHSSFLGNFVVSFQNLSQKNITNRDKVTKFTSSNYTIIAKCI